MKGLLIFLTAAELSHVWIIPAMGISSVMSLTPLLASSSDLYDVASAVGGNWRAPVYSVPSKWTVKTQALLPEDLYTDPSPPPLSFTVVGFLNHIALVGGIDCLSLMSCG